MIGLTCIFSKRQRITHTHVEEKNNTPDVRFLTSLLYLFFFRVSDSIH